ncbi:hypothetical protein DEU36_2904 [Microbacterium sp. AG238]|nr:hypothetical protein DEU36_2904 [Microbacterium sp. AG238]
MARVTPPDLELWLASYVRACADRDGHNVTVSNKEPVSLALPITRPVIVIRDDSGARLSEVTFDRSIGASVLAGSRSNDKPANDLARWLYSVLQDDAIVTSDGSPIASVEWGGFNGPYPVADSLDVARRYFTGQYTVVGSW